jgi:hypothetical protein
MWSYWKVPLQLPRNRAKIAQLRLENWMQQHPWSVVLAQIGPLSDIRISISRCVIIVAGDKALILDSRHQKRHDRPLRL